MIKIPSKNDEERVKQEEQQIEEVKSLKNIGSEEEKKPEESKPEESKPE